MDTTYLRLLDSAIFQLLKNAVRISIHKPSSAPFFARTLIQQKVMEKRRSFWNKQGIHVPPFMIFSVTNRCNLRCKGCYNQAQHSNTTNELSSNKLLQVVNEADELGISFILIAGGEPLVREDIFQAAHSAPNILFPVFTNGLLIDSKKIDLFRQNKNLIPIISLEGHQEETDQRRGEGVYHKLTGVFERLNHGGVFFGTSITVTRENFSLVTGDAFIKELLQKGCNLFFFVEYIPVREGTENLMLTEDQHRELQTVLEPFRNKYIALFTAFPGDEEKFGGCLSAGRGFVHMNWEGRLEPCPFAPYSDTETKSNAPLKEALQSDFLRKIRENHKNLSETNGICALWENRDWVKSLLN